MKKLNKFQKNIKGWLLDFSQTETCHVKDLNEKKESTIVLTHFMSGITDS